MAGDFVVLGEGWGKIRGDDEFAPVWKLFVYFLVELVVIIFLSDFATPYITGATRSISSEQPAW